MKSKQNKQIKRKLLSGAFLGGWNVPVGKRNKKKDSIHEQIDKLNQKTTEVEETLNSWVHNLFIEYADLRNQMKDLRFRLYKLNLDIEEKNEG